MYTTKYVITIAASRAKVWDALTNPDVVKKYFYGTTLKSTWKKGEPVIWTGEWEGKSYVDKGVLLDIEKEKYIKYSYFSSFSGKPDVPENYHNISYKLNDVGGNTELVIEQDGHETEDAARQSEQSWTGVMDGMRKLVEEK